MPDTAIQMPVAFQHMTAAHRSALKAMAERTGAFTNTDPEIAYPLDASPAWKAGRLAGMDDASEFANPYTRFSDDHEDWELGRRGREPLLRLRARG